MIPHLEELAELGVTAIELMPIADFPGRRGWGYDGVYFWAAHEAYGGPDGLQRLVDAAHAAGLGVLLDLVLNHVGASGEQAIRAFGPYFTDKYSTFWGEAINYDGEWSGPAREWAIQAAEMWVRDLHLDGLRLDAVHAIFDQSAEHVVAELARRVHAANPRALVIAESGLNDPKVVRDAARGGWGCDAAWADDVHHAIRTLVTDEREGYYAEFGALADLAHAFRDPHVHDGRWSAFRKRRFGAPAADCPPERFVVFDQNHDQVGNRALGDRLPARRTPAGRVLHVAVALHAACCSWARSTARPRRFSSSPTTSTRRSPSPPARDAAASSPRLPASRARRCRIRRTPRRSRRPS